MLFSGLGENQYEVQWNWAKLPDDISLKNISAVSVDQQGRVFALLRSDPFMLVFSSDGELIDKWSDHTVVDGHYLTISEDNHAFVVDRDNHRIIEFTDKGEIIQIIGRENAPGDLGKPFNHPTDIAMNSNGEYFVSDGYGNACVHHFDSAGQLIKSWGKLGSDQGEFSTPHAILVDKRGRVLVSDRENNRIQIFNQEGIYLEEINNLYFPTAIYEDNYGFIYVTDRVPSLSMFHPDGKLIGRCLSNGHGLTVDRDGNVYLSNKKTEKITKLVKI
ncbi:6-bladed beta-propeller [Ornithinibacillus sp. 4-3]|uniref:6-bladed beta-propeller n=1 Tax=Ornithinibacillus sp. 4-3 TaxID=3231488 RepID=A0AB39HRA1_9BACI